MTKNIIIVGAGENGYVIRNIFDHQNFENKFIGFLDDVKVGPEILGKVSDFHKFQEAGDYFFVAIGGNGARRDVFLKLKEAGARFVNAIHPSAFVESDLILGNNVMIGALSYVNVRSTIGNGTFINNGCTVEHDNQIGDFCHLAPRVVTGGGVIVGDGTFIGLNSAIRDHVKIGEGAIIGMASAVVGPVEDNITVYGNPAKVARKK
ncbi:MAG: hypothetical protein A2431_02270 [Candidatus Zambryskibacteria bacterium RIFOXYC1_FULL_39_10]|uniref:PglD N-terminal domain-containing protein n=1 Tax=Candidatus Zambryskibacteria bacterium RIFOXYC1_FULL_39_10 TaxID=1802779 RepID=A0A1G2V3M6_9BACT|nr:MAG: hypothetical protein A2431_02270 [Candidatus Zambryskibacteria bacterium RIFOXYC1_FULL_39_10]OHB16742.1 MAG: hypothetical protein A2605_01120 [Candidatus Zambryskibacteria bacterium RIFOXYD1_FULL_39_35]